MDSCFVLIGTRQHGVAVLYETSNSASSNKMQQNPCPIKFRTLNLPAQFFCHFHQISMNALKDLMTASQEMLAAQTLLDHTTVLVSLDT